MIKSGKNSIRSYMAVSLVGFVLFSGCASISKTKPDLSGTVTKKETTAKKNPAKPGIESEDIKPSDSSKENEYTFDQKNTSKDSGKSGKPENRIIKKSSGPSHGISSYNPQSPDSSGDVVLNFDDADLLEVIRTFAEILGINYTLESEISGKVTIHTSRGLNKKDIFPVFYQILEANGLTAVKDGNFYRITGLQDTSRMPLRFKGGKDGKELPPDERMAVQIIPLKHVTADEMSKILEPFVTEFGTLITHESSNMILLIEKNSVIQKVNYLVDMFDVDNLANAAHRFYKLKYTTPEEMSKLLGEVLSAFNKGKKDLVKFVAVQRLSLLIAVSSDSESLKWLDRMVSEFDVPGEEGESKIFVYFVKNGIAKDIGGILGSVFGIVTAAPESGQNSVDGNGNASQQTQVKGSAQPQGSTAQANPYLNSPQASVSSPQNLSAGLAGGGGETASQAGGGQKQSAPGSGLSSSLKGKVKITADETRNALIIEAMPSDYRMISGILKILDVLPRQVLIEVTIADISLNDKDSLGVDWSYKAGAGNPGASLLEAYAGSSGLKFVVGEQNRWTATLASLASKNKAKILSAPTVLASDNKEAKIDIADEIPVVSTEYTASATGSTPVFQTNVEYKKTGIMLAVTPHINENGLVSMKLSQEVSDVGGSVIAAGKEYTSFKKRTITTDLTVGDNQTIVLGGLMKESRDKGSAGVPILSSIPVIGFLFGKQTENVSKTELIILITPKVIKSLDSVDKMTESFRNKIETVFINDSK